MKKINKEFNQISRENLIIISNVLKIVECYVHDYKYCKDESNSNVKIFRSIEFEEYAGIKIDLQKESIWFQDETVFYDLNCFENDSIHRKFVEYLVVEKLMMLVK